MHVHKHNSLCCHIQVFTDISVEYLIFFLLPDEMWRGQRLLERLDLNGVTGAAVFVLYEAGVVAPIVGQ